MIYEFEQSSFFKAGFILLIMLFPYTTSQLLEKNIIVICHTRFVVSNLHLFVGHTDLSCHKCCYFMSLIWIINVTISGIHHTFNLQYKELLK